MKKILSGALWLTIICVMSCNVAQGQIEKLLANGAVVKKVADGFKFTEGPVSDAMGNVYFTDQPNNQILKYSMEGELSVFHKGSGRANGMYFSPDEKLVACADEDNELWVFEMDGSHTVRLSGQEGSHFNGPNDLWIDPDGGIFFTDPLYKRPWWEGRRSAEMEKEGQYVYYLAKGSKTPIAIETSLKQPNGIFGIVSAKTLFVADIGDGKTYKYSYQEDGTLSDRALFADMGSDGMTADRKGNVYLTGKKGVTVFNKKGQEIGVIAIPANWTANVCFGGKDMKTLFITSMDGLYAVEMKVKGLR